MTSIAYASRIACLTILSVAPIARDARAQAAPTCGMPGAERWQATRPSPLDSAKVTVGGHGLMICYSRPSARGRSIDSLVPVGRAWRTGANEPTTLTLTGRLSVGGVVLEPGPYVLLTVPGADDWQLIFHTTPETEPAKMVATLRQVAVGSGSVEKLVRPIEQFTIRAVPDDDGATLFLEWDHWRVHVPIRAVK